jgi:hypothetical protein
VQELEKQPVIVMNRVMLKCSALVGSAVEILEPEVMFRVVVGLHTVLDCEPLCVQITFELVE